MSLIARANPQLRWGHGWTRNSSREISIFRNEINALLDFEGGVNVARDFTVCRVNVALVVCITKLLPTRNALPEISIIAALVH